MIRVKVGNASVDVSGLEAVVERAQSLAAPIMQRLDEFGRRVMDEARAGWPVGKRPRRVRSRDLLSHEVVQAGVDSFKLRLVSGAEYTRYIRAISLNGRNPWQVLVRKPAADRTDELALAIAADIARVTGG